MTPSIAPLQTSEGCSTKYSRISSNSCDATLISHITATFFSPHAGVLYSLSVSLSLTRPISVFLAHSASQNSIPIALIARLCSFPEQDNPTMNQNKSYSEFFGSFENKDAATNQLFDKVRRRSSVCFSRPAHCVPFCFPHSSVSWRCALTICMFARLLPSPSNHSIGVCAINCCHFVHGCLFFAGGRACWCASQSFARVDLQCTWRRNNNNTTQFTH